MTTYDKLLNIDEAYLNHNYRLKLKGIIKPEVLNLILSFAENRNDEADYKKNLLLDCIRQKLKVIMRKLYPEDEFQSEEDMFAIFDQRDQKDEIDLNKPPKCPYCGSLNTEWVNNRNILHCKNCGHIEQRINTGYQQSNRYVSKSRSLKVDESVSKDKVQELKDTIIKPILKKILDDFNIDIDANVENNRNIKNIISKTLNMYPSNQKSQIKNEIKFGVFEFLIRKFPDFHGANALNLLDVFGLDRNKYSRKVKNILKDLKKNGRR